MDANVAEQPDIAELIRKSRTKANRLFFLVVILSALFFIFVGPTLIDRGRGYMMGIRSAEEGERNAALWMRNPTCGANPQAGSATQSGNRVEATVCPSGDILIRVVTPQGKTIYGWKPLDDVVRKSKSGEFVPVAVS